MSHPLIHGSDGTVTNCATAVRFRRMNWNEEEHFLILLVLMTEDLMRRDDDMMMMISISKIQKNDEEQIDSGLEFQTPLAKLSLSPVLRRRQPASTAICQQQFIEGDDGSIFDDSSQNI